MPSLAAQETPPAQPDQPPPNLYTLHVYTNLIQIPTLVLDSAYAPIHNLGLSQFSMSIDAGPVFHPTQMRIEGDDPISMAVLIDASGSEEEELLRKLPGAFAGLAPQYLHPPDQLIFFAMDCKLIRSKSMIPATPGDIQIGLAAALTTAGLHGKKSRGACAQTTHLWDAVTAADVVLRNLPGRRVLLIISSGRDHQGVNKFDDVLHFTSQYGITVLGIRDLDDTDFNIFSPLTRNGIPISSGSAGEDDFSFLCKSNGGVVLGTRSGTLVSILQTFVTMLRTRYILEFPRPDNSTAGRHNIDVTIRNKIALVLPTGVSASLPDPATLADPNTVPSAPSPAQMGSHKPPNQSP